TGAFRDRTPAEHRPLVDEDPRYPRYSPRSSPSPPQLLSRRTGRVSLFQTLRLILALGSGPQRPHVLAHATGTGDPDPPEPGLRQLEGDGILCCELVEGEGARVGYVPHDGIGGGAGEPRRSVSRSDDAVEVGAAAKRRRHRNLRHFTGRGLHYAELALL